MADRVTKEDLMRYMDGEMPPEQRARLDTELERSTELKRELAIFRAMRTDFQGLSFDPGTYHKSMWDKVNASVTRPIGWVLVVVGVVVWTGLRRVPIHYLAGKCMGKACHRRHCDRYSHTLGFRDLGALPGLGRRPL